MGSSSHEVAAGKLPNKQKTLRGGGFTDNEKRLKCEENFSCVQRAFLSKAKAVNSVLVNNALLCW